jgi:FdhD protein
METVKITRIKADTKEVVDDLLACEVPLTIIIGDQELVTLLCTPEDIDDLVKGFLFTSGLIKDSRDIKKIVLDQEQWTAHVDLDDNLQLLDMVFKRLYTSGCGKGTFFYNMFDIIHRAKIASSCVFKSNCINSLMVDFQKRSEVFSKTGGVHSAAIADNNTILVFREDIGRHNAIDKVIGQMISNNCSFEDKIMITSGRISSEIIFKIQKCRIPIIISRSAPTDQAVKLARDMGIILVGFARGYRMNIYSEEERIIHG